MKIELGKIYVDTTGAKWRIASLQGPIPFPILGVNDLSYEVRSYDPDGSHTYWPHLVSEYNAWNDVKVDTPIWVRDITYEDWVPRHFAGLSGDHFLAWTNGGTSHSIHDHHRNQTTLWLQATLQRPESLLPDEQA